MDRINSLLESDDKTKKIAVEILAGIVICAIIYIIILIIKAIIDKSTNASNDAPVIFSGLVNAKKVRVAVQNPNEDESVTLHRSINEQGIEYTYSVWLFFDGESWSSENNNWKHIFHKGPKIDGFQSNNPDISPLEICPIQCPGLWLSPIDNTLRLYVNTYETNKEYIEITNLPVKKWIHFVLTQQNFTTNIFINGRLKRTFSLQSLPRQNYYDLYITDKGGFTGYLSKMQYFNYVLSPTSIYDLAKKGPNLTQDSSELDNEENAYLKSNLPYLSNRWWVDDLTKN